MTKSIVDLFYDNGGYASSSLEAGKPNYISVEDATSTYIPQALIRFNSLCQITAAIDTVSYTSTDVMHDQIIAELALELADREYDTIHTDPDTGLVENRHWDAAYRYMLDLYGIPVNQVFGRRQFLLPREALDATGARAAYSSMSIATMSI